MILITGATGTVGSEVVKRLSAQGVQVRAVTRDLRKAEASPLPHVEFVKGDFDDLDSMQRACSGMERAFLLSNSTERAEQQQTAFVEVAKKSGVQHIVKLSQLHADVNSPGRFLRYHAAVEAAVQAAGLTFTFLRPNLYMQGLLNFRQSIKEKSAFFVAAGEARISAVDVRDLAEVAVAALTGTQLDSKNYSLTGPEALTFGEMAQRLSAALGSDHYVC
ncbi:MAG: SDR family oxidoreductase [bacterium]